MESICAQTRSRYILSYRRGFLGRELKSMLNPLYLKLRGRIKLTKLHHAGSRGLDLNRDNSLVTWAGMLILP